MSTKISAHGVSLEDALSKAVAELVDTDVGKVKLLVEAPSVENVNGSVRFDLKVEAPVIEAANEGRAGTPEAVISAEDLDEEADAAADFLEGLLDALDLPGDLRIKTHGDHAELEIVDVGNGALIGRRGQTLEAIQELARCTLQRQFQRRSRVKIDIEGYRGRRMEKLVEKAEDAIDTVLDSGDPERLEPMDVFERKAIHQLVADVDGVESRSQGREPARRVVIEPA